MALSDEARAARNEYRRKWRKENMDKVIAQQERYWQRKAQGLKDGGEGKAND